MPRGRSRAGLPARSFRSRSRRTTLSLIAAWPGLSDEARALRAGHAVIPRSQADYRGLSVGDAIVLSHAGRVRIRVGAITDDDRVFRSELILPLSTADRLGLERSRAVVLAAQPEAAGAIETALEALAGDLPIRIRVPQPRQGTFSSGGRGLLSLAGVKMTFGEFWYRPLAGIAIAVDPAWRKANIAERRPAARLRHVPPQGPAATDRRDERGCVHSACPG